MLWDCLGLLVRSSIVLIVADLLSRLPRRTTPAYRHRLLVTGFLVLLVWPLFPLFVPELAISFAHRAPLHGLVTVQQTMRTGHPAGGISIAFLIRCVWSCGVCAALLLVLVGHLQVLRWKRRSTAVPDEQWETIARELAKQCGLHRMPSTLLVDGNVMPLTYGVFRRSILLPADCLSWSASKRRAVLLHEFAHIKRHDTFWLLLVNLVSALWWFQPLCWVFRRRVRVESEQACDSEVVACGMQPSAYAAELLAIAKDFRCPVCYSFSTLAMAVTGSLELRLRSILNTRVQSSYYQSPTTGASFTLFAAAILCSAISVATNGQLISKGGLSMRRTLYQTMFSGLLTSASLSAAAIGGSVLDPAGAAVLNAKASLYNPETKARQETLSMADGKFGFTHLEAGQYILRVDKPGFAPIFREFNVQENSTVDRGLTLQSGGGQQVRDARPDAMPPGEPKPMRVGGKVAQNNLMTKVQPIYPLAAKKAGIQGTVLLEAVISAEGMPLDIRVVSSPREDLSQSALEAVRQWIYRPTLLNGNPVEIITDIVVNYTLAP